jgi:hypothetical protein
VPFIALLSMASTARDIYAAPAVPGLVLLVALWARQREVPRPALTATRALVLLISGVIALAAALIAAASGAGPNDVLMVPVLIALIATLCVQKARQLDAYGDRIGSLVTTAAGMSIALVLGSVSTFPAIDRWQNLASLGHDIHRDSDGKPLALLQPDETTLAMLDDPLRSQPAPIRAADTSGWFCQHPKDGRLLVMLPGHAPGELSRLLGRWWHEKRPGDGDAASIEREGVAKLLQRYELPHGRRYGLMGPTSTPCNHEAPAVEGP